MLIVVRSPLGRLVAVAVSLIIFAVVYFTVIKPSNDTANKALKTGTQQLQQAEQQANQSLQQASQQSKQAGQQAQQASKQADQQVRQAEQQANQAVQQANKATGGAVPAGAQKLTSCIAAAGTDATKIQACQAQYHP